MSDKIFIDTNVLLYLYSEDDTSKRDVVNLLFDKNECVLSTQVLIEFMNVGLKKFNISHDKMIEALIELESNFQIHINTTQSIKLASLISQKYKYSWFDSLIVASALESKCTSLITEDMQHNQPIENSIRIVNPFL
jgi:predicted nucleic acid-binding protein